MSPFRNTPMRKDVACCWTCKLRRKKCDAKTPTCHACESRAITCHGFGDRPEWLNGGDDERAELKRIKDAVKQNNKRKRAEMFRSQTEDGQRKTPRVSVEKDEVEGHDRGSDWNDGRPQVQDLVLELPEETSVILPDGSSRQTPSTAVTPSATHFVFGRDREFELLMHYLDHVFALQFRFHAPSVASGGRGWLLWLLNDTIPLRHAALSLGALHQHSLLARSARGQQHHDTLNELNEHHNRALQELQIFLQSSYENSVGVESGRKRRLQILACGVQLISFELFRGGTSQWQVHLDALATVVRSMAATDHSNNALSPGQSDGCSPVDLTQDYSDGLQRHRLEDTAEHFLVGAVLWFDILSCASTNQPPRLHSESARLLPGRIDLANIIGCQPWVALAIGEIATLNAWKSDATVAGTLSSWRLFERGDPIRRRLEDGISSLRKEIDGTFAELGLSHLGTTGAYLVLTNPALQQEAIKRAITLVFAYAAQVYLNTIISGADPKLDDVKTSVADTMNALQEMQYVCDAQALRSLIWPICIAGSMAQDVPTQSYFQSLIQGLGDEAHDFGNSATALKVMRNCWSSRDDGRSYDWSTAMELLDERVLLV